MARVTADGHLPSTQRYDELAYTSLPYGSSQPDPVAVVAQLAGLEIADPATWRVLELGCGDGGNLLAIAQAHPGMECLGLDANASAIDRGRALAAEAGVDVTLLHADLTDLPDGLGEFDVVFLHGVWSWVPERVRACVPAAMASLLKPAGIAYVSYLAKPGFHMLAPARDLARRAARGETDPDRAVRLAHERLRFIAPLAPNGVYATMLRFELDRWGTRPDFLVFHDILDPDATAFSLEDLTAAMAPAGLTWLGEMRPEQWWPWLLHERSSAQLAEHAGDDPATRQQLFDDIQGTSFKATLFTRADAAPPRDADASRVLGLLAAAPPDPPAEAAAPGVAEEAILRVLGPMRRPVPELLEAAGLAPELGAPAVLRLAAVGLLGLHRLPHAWSPVVADEPVASPLARAQAEHATSVSTLDHRVVTLQDDAQRALLLMLDGTRDRPALMRGLLQAADAEPDDAPAYMEKVDTTIGLFARRALLMPPA